MSLKIEALRKQYHQGSETLEILKGVSAEFKLGETVAIVGQSGSGKSTLLSLLAGLDRPSSGDVIVDGQSLNQLSEEEMTHFRGERIGIVFQQFHLLPHLTALENVMIPLEILKPGPDVRDKALKLLKQVDLGHRANHLPSQLSGGECQRVAIARALVVEPRLLLADEPSGNLDPTTGEKVMGLFFDVVRKAQVTGLLVTHSRELAARCDRVLELKNGVLC